MDLQPAALRPMAACAYLGVGRTKIYELIRDGHLQAVKVGRCTLISRESLDRLVSATQPAPRQTDASEERR